MMPDAPNQAEPERADKAGSQVEGLRRAFQPRQLLWALGRRSFYRPPFPLWGRGLRNHGEPSHRLVDGPRNPGRP
jgi:hypothetical protein